MILSKRYKEGFETADCTAQYNCSDCASSSGCAWCVKKKKCLRSSFLNTKDYDGQCSQNNGDTLTSAFLCPSELDNKIPSDMILEDDILFDYALYKNKITDKIPPPNVFTTSQMEYTPETVMGNVNRLAMIMQNNQKNLPGIVASTVQENIRPMVVGILSDNYYVQG